MENAFPEEIKSGACIHQLCQALNFIVKAFDHALIPFRGEVREDGIVVFPQVASAKLSSCLAAGLRGMPPR